MHLCVSPLAENEVGQAQGWLAHLPSRQDVHEGLCKPNNAQHRPPHQQHEEPQTDTGAGGWESKLNTIDLLVTLCNRQRLHTWFAPFVP
jgi:hypothetical protein